MRWLAILLVTTLPAFALTPDGQSIVANVAGVLRTNAPIRSVVVNGGFCPTGNIICPTDLAGVVNYNGTNLSAIIPTLAANSTVELCNDDPSPLALQPGAPIRGYSQSTLPGLSNGAASCLFLTSDGAQWWATVVIPPQGSTPPPTGDTLVLMMSEDRYINDAQFNVYMDGVKLNYTVLTTTATSGSQQQFSFTGTWGNGAHVLGIEFLNDAYAGPGQDLNLYLINASYDGSASLGNLNLYNDGIQTLNIPAH